MRKLKVGELVKFKCSGNNKPCIGKVTKRSLSYTGYILTIVLPGCGELSKTKVCGIYDREELLPVTKEDKVNILKYMLVGKR